jgi:hypothetical protein
MQPKAADVNLQSYEVRDSGALMLLVRGKRGSLAPEHMENYYGVPLGLTQELTNPTLAPVPPNLPCEICGRPEDEHVMLLCDRCNTGYHMHCLPPPLEWVAR